jgi:hypothetical protein
MRSHVLAGLLGIVALAAAARGQEPATPAAAEGYVWAEACKECHPPIYEAWGKTKHARAIARLGGEQRQAGSPCIGCHVTGPKEPVMAGNSMVNASVQCESCHGAGKAHVEAARAGSAASARLVKSPPESVCQTCHNEKSPHYRGFFYTALKGLVHKVS